MGAFCHKTEQKTALKCVFQEKTRKKTLADGKGTPPRQKKGCFYRFSAQNPPFSADFRFDRVCETAKFPKIPFRYGDLVRLGGNALLPHPFYPDFFRHFRHSGSPDRQFFRKATVRNLQFWVKNARCDAMRAIFDPFSDPFPVGKTGNFSKIYVKKEVFHNHFWHIGNPKAIKQLPTDKSD